jgi:branched-chain amino acid transport system ATP-binding protein
MSPPKEDLVIVESLTKRFAGFLALNEISLKVVTGSIHGIIGPNGAGKTTLFNLLSGLLRPDHGKILLDGHNITRLKPHERTALGIARTFQNIRVFGQMTVLQNVMVGRHSKSRSGLLNLVFQPPFRKSASEKILEETARKCLEFVGLSDYMDYRAHNLPYGEQRRLELARALACEPKLLLLDEPAAGMNTAETNALSSTIRKINESAGTTIILIEHKMDFIMSISGRISVMNFGNLIFEGTPDEARKSPTVIEAYLGTEDGL